MKTLVGTYRKVNRDWILREHLYNLPLAERAHPDSYRSFDALVLFRNDDAPIAATISYLKIVDTKELIRLGYAPGQEPHGNQYVLFRLSDEKKAARLLSDPKSDLCICSTRFTGNVDADFYRKPLPNTGGKTIPAIFEHLRPYCALWHSAFAANPVQCDFLSALDADNSVTVPFSAPAKGKFTFIDLFAGIGGIRMAYQQLGGKCVFSSEWDPGAAKTYEANFGERPHGDITKIDPASIPDFDVLLGGFPCQPFSIIGDKEGFRHETQGTLFFNIEKILLTKRPKAFMLENVRNLTAHDNGRTFKIIRQHLEAAGYDVHAKVLNALDYGVPQKRERIIICGFRKKVDFNFPEPVPIAQRKTVADIIDPAAEKDRSLFVRSEIRTSRLARLKDRHFPKPYISHENVAGTVTPHNFSCALRAGASANYILVNDERRPSPREMLRIQGFPDEFRVVVNYSQIKHQCGNSVAVPVIRAVAEKLVPLLKEIEP